MARHQDVFVKETDYVSDEATGTFEAFNPEATDETVITHPTPDHRQWELELPLVTARANANRERFLQEFSTDEDSIAEVFDAVVCDLTKATLVNEGFTDCGVPPHLMRALLLREAWQLSSFEALSEHINRYTSDDLERLGLQQAYEESWYRKNAKQIGDSQALSDAGRTVVLAIFEMGVPVPKTVQDAHDLSYNRGPEASDFSLDAADYELYTLIDELLEVVDRNLNPEQNGYKEKRMRKVLGAFAHAAHIDKSVENYRESAHHSFDVRSELSGSAIRRYTDDLALWEVEDLFHDINIALLEYVIDSGALTQPATISYDLTGIKNLGRGQAVDSFLTEDGRWRFASLSFTDSEFEFAFGLKLLKSESHRSSTLRQFLSDLTEMTDVRLLLADRGFDGVKDIEACRAFLPERWVIFAKDRKKSGIKSHDYEKLRRELTPGGAVAFDSAGYENLQPSTNLFAYSGAKDDKGKLEPIRAFYTDIQIPSDEKKKKKLIRDLNFVYNQRGKIETQFRLSKNEFDVATDTDDPVRKAFYFHVSTLLYNIYKIVNTVPSPHGGVTFDKSTAEVLEVVRDLALGGPQPPDTMTRVLDPE